jgi:XRE family transcriptional regulator, regulator of sulfur utilization
MDDPDQVAGHLARNLAALRHVRGLTQDALAKAAGVPRSTIANLESGEGNPSLAVLVKVAGALSAPIDELLGAPRARTRKWAAEDIAAQRPPGGITLRPLVPEPAPGELLNIMDFAPGSNMRGTPHLPNTREYFTLLDGNVVIFVAGERYELKPGEVLAFPGNLPHAYQNASPTAAARGISVVVLAKTGS